MTNNKLLQLKNRFALLNKDNGDVDHSVELRALSQEAINFSESKRFTFSTREDVCEANKLASLGSLADRVAHGHEIKSAYRRVMACACPNKDEAKQLAHELREYILFSGVAGTLHQATEWADMLNQLNRL